MEIIENDGSRSIEQVYKNITPFLEEIFKIQKRWMNDQIVNNPAEPVYSEMGVALSALGIAYLRYLTGTLEFELTRIDDIMAAGSAVAQTIQIKTKIAEGGAA